MNGGTERGREAVEEADIGSTEREQRGPGNCLRLLLPEVSVAGRRQSVAKEKRRAAEGVDG